jgi:hypothetical protein
MIAVELFNGAVEIRLDDAGIDDLVRQLQSLRGQQSHLHFMTPSWGGKELAERAAHGELINHLVVYSVQENSN